MNTLPLDRMSRLPLIEIENPFARDYELVDPYNAIEWLAYGEFSSNLSKPRLWVHCDQESVSLEATKEAGRQELAEEIIVNNIFSGNLRCVFVRREREAFARNLLVLDSEHFKVGEFTHDWEDGPLRLYNVEDDAPDITEFWLFWHEVKGLYARCGTREPEDRGNPADWLEPVAKMPASTPPAVDRTPSRRGRTAKGHGAAIASFTLELNAQSIEIIEAMSYNDLGYRLIEAYKAAGENPPHHDTAGKDASAARSAVLRARKRATVLLPNCASRLGQSE